MKKTIFMTVLLSTVLALAFVSCSLLSNQTGKQQQVANAYVDPWSNGADRERERRARIELERQQAAQQQQQQQQQQAQAAQQQQQAEQARLQAEAALTTPNSPNDFDIMQNAQGGITITGYKGTRTNVIIPETISGIRVTEIASNAFSYKSLRSVVIPNTVTSIGGGAFVGNAQLSSVVLPNAITSIGGFRGCTALQSITIPNSVTVIDYYAFADCSLTSITLPPRLTSIDQHAFENNQLTTVQFPASLRIIERFTFFGNKITRIVIPETITVLREFSFGENPLVSIVIPSSLARMTGGTNPPYYFFSSGFVGAFCNRADRNAPLERSAIGIPNETITSITLPANVSEENLAYAFFDKRNFDESFINFWKSQNRRAGTYVKEGRIWRVQ